MSEKVYIRAIDSYSEESVEKIIRELISSVLGEKGINNVAGKRVVIKPNLLSKKDPSAAVTTHPAFVSAAAKEFLERGASVTVADSPGGPYNQVIVDGIYETCLMKKACESCGAKLNYDFGHTVMRNENGVMSKTFEIINPLANADIIVDVCRMKTHALCLMSAAVKNMFGSIPGLTKAEMHARFPKISDFSNFLIDLCETVKPCISIVDAIEGMEGNGPSAGSVKKVGAILASGDPYRLDLVCSKIMGFDASEVDTVKHSIERGLCPENVEEIEIDGEKIERFATSFVRPDSKAGGLIKQLPSLLGGRIQSLVEPHPVIIKNKCVGCGECKKCCPRDTIEIVERKAKINRRNCIKCYCCQELCPKKAIEIRRNFIFKV